MLATAAIGAETYIRFVSVATDSLGASLTNKRWRQAYVRLNSLYFRDKEWSQPKPDGVVRIAFVGDSFTYGWGVNDPADRFTDLLQARFDHRAPGKYEVMNVAWGGWDTKKELEATRDWLPPYGVDEVVLCYLPNDIEWLVPAEDAARVREPLRPRFVNLEGSFLLDYLFHRLVAPRLRPGPPYRDWLAAAYEDPGLWARQAGVLQSLIALCKERNVRLRVVLIPFLQGEGARYDTARIHAQVATVFESAAVPVVDLWPAVQDLDPSELIVNRFDGHPNEAAHRIFADRIWERFYE
jgi:lysophospholipase L1-like esterase